MTRGGEANNSRRRDPAESIALCEQRRPAALSRMMDYWTERLTDSPVLELPTDFPRPAVQTYRGATQEVVLDQSLAQALERLSRQEGATLFMTLLAAWQVLLSRYSGQEDVVVGSPIAGRNQ